MIKKILSSLMVGAAGIMSMLAADPTATAFSAAQCEGSAMPYPAPKETIATPDSLTAVLINHVGRHGARYPSSPRAVNDVRQALLDADSLGTITPLGRTMLKLTEIVTASSKGRWGALDSLGMAEQRGIASRMLRTFPRLFKHGRVKAMSSKVPRCVNSMYTFLYQLTRLDSSIDIEASSGPMESPLLRPFDTDETYRAWVEEGTWRAPLEEYEAAHLPLSPLMRLLGNDFQMPAEDARALALSLYKVLSGMSAMMRPVDVNRFLTTEEYNALWACNNLRQYLLRTATTLSMTPAEIASPLLLEMINTTQAAVDADKAAKKGERRDGTDVYLRFGHAETMMPLLSLMRLPGCYYMTNYFDTVGLHWQNFHVAPMASNLQIILLRTKAGKYYVRVELNEVPVTLDGDGTEVYIPWDAARDRLLRCIPLYLRI